jgi:Helix-turn-helix domain
MKGKLQHGYTLFQLPTRIGRRTSMFAHRAVALAFHGKPPRPGMDASPQDGNRQNCTPSNIKWQNRKATMFAKRRHGTQQFNEVHKWAKLTWTKVHAIRRIGARKNRPTYSEIAERFGVSRNTIRRVINREARGGWHAKHRRYYRKLKSPANQGRSVT